MARRMYVAVSIELRSSAGAPLLLVPLSMQRRRAFNLAVRAIKLLSPSGWMPLSASTYTSFAFHIRLAIAMQTFRISTAD